jgi:membrane-associated phospholipid phosphatase
MAALRGKNLLAPVLQCVNLGILMQSNIPLSPPTAIPASEAAPPTLDCRAIFLNDFWFKFFGTGAFISLFFWAYLYVLKNPAFPVFTIPLTVVDHWIGFTPLALIPYLSLWIYCSLPVMLMPARGRLLNFGAWVGAMCMLALAVFYWLPNAVPPANIEWALYPGVAFLKDVDAAGNACPSLHVATAVYSGFWLYWLLQEMRMGWHAQTVQILWGGAIAYSTMATKQHVSLDVLAGIALGTAFALGSRRFDRKLQPCD